ncbi:putative nuclease HARBI1 [Saccostrea cucullata]|uniref:putative nuclease HARBI1 n=1 Tax=Saccostrea cuccullata TaxID=36930 RepID=UPI002ED586A2
MVKIIAPKVNEADYICRKGYYAINVQMMCDARFKIRDVVAKWPGSVHDSRIFRESHLCRVMEEGQLQGVLLGDSGYGLKPYLLTPYLATETSATQKFNAAHSRTRVTIEQAFGVLKKRFNALHSGLRTCPERACRVITACAVLHNIGLDRGDILRDVPEITAINEACEVPLPEDVQGCVLQKNLRLRPKTSDCWIILIN